MRWPFEGLDCRLFLLLSTADFHQVNRAVQLRARPGCSSELTSRLINTCAVQGRWGRAWVEVGGEGWGVGGRRGGVGGVGGVGEKYKRRNSCLI